jgi:hypothetical protein
MISAARVARHRPQGRIPRAARKLASLARAAGSSRERSSLWGSQSLIAFGVTNE